MFVKKDLRKIPQILADATSRAVASPPSDPNPADDDDNNDDGNDNENSNTTKKNDKNNSNNADDDDDDDATIVTEVRFARRAPEFLPSCGVSLLLEPRYRPALDNLVQLSLYDCGLQTLTGMELQSSSSSLDVGGTGGGGGIAPPLFPKLTSLDIGRNPKLTNDSLPNTFHTQFPRLLQLWSDDCGFGPDIPPSLLEMERLEVVRMTGNRLEGKLEGGIGIRYWKSARVLAFDGNKLSGVGKGIGKLKYLEKLHLRGNKLVALPEGVPGGDNSNLTAIGLSSNQLTSLPVSLLDVAATLKELYLNGNQIERLPEGLAEKLVGLTKLNLAHNIIGNGEKDTSAAGSQSTRGITNDGDVTMEDAEDDGIRPPPLPQDFVDRFGMPDPLTGMCTKDECVVRMEGNPMAESIRKKHLEEEKRKAKEMAMETEAETTESIQ